MSTRKEWFYFSHDSNASNDPKIVQLRAVYGWEGYGMYWKMIETMREQNDFTIDVSGKYALDGIAQLLSIDIDKATAFIEDCTSEFKLFKAEHGRLFSESLIRRMEAMTQRQHQAQEAARKRWGKPSTTDALPEQSDSTATAGKKKRGKKPAAPGDARPGSVEDAIAYFTEEKFVNPQIEAKKFWNHYQTNGWKVGGRTAMKDWKASAYNWNERRIEYDGNGNGTTRPGTNTGTGGPNRPHNNTTGQRPGKGKYDE